MSGGLAVGVDLGGTQVRVALVDPAGGVLARVAALTDAQGGPRAVVQQIRRLVGEATRDVDPSRLLGVGISSPGPLDGQAGVVLSIPTLPGWVDIPVVEWLREALHLPCVLENDGVAAAIGEWRFGAARGLQDFVYVTVSTGIGGGVVSDGRVLRGRRGMAAHIGHMSILPEGGMACSCGNFGCWEAQASGTAFGNFARKAAADAPGSDLCKPGSSLEAADVMAAARAGNALATRLVAHEARVLGVGIVNLLHLFSPEAIVVGGGMAHGFDLLRAGIEQQIQGRALQAFRDVPVLLAQLGQNSGLVGAASLVTRPA